METFEIIYKGKVVQWGKFRSWRSAAELYFCKFTKTKRKKTDYFVRCLNLSEERTYSLIKRDVKTQIETEIDQVTINLINPTLQGE